MWPYDPQRMIHYKMSANPYSRTKGRRDAILESGDNVTYGTIPRTAKWRIKAERGSGVKLERLPGKRPLKTVDPVLGSVDPVLGSVDFHQHSGNQWMALSSNTRVKWIWMDYSVCFIKYRLKIWREKVYRKENC